MQRRYGRGCCYTAVLIVRRVLARPTVTVQSIYGALSAYIIIGLMFAAFYTAMQHLGAGSFFADGQPGDTQTFQYFSFTTLTTLGYGDFTPASDGGHRAPSAALRARTAGSRPGTAAGACRAAHRRGHFRMLTARDTTSMATIREIAASAIIISLAQVLIAETSVGLNAMAVMNDRCR